MAKIFSIFDTKIVPGADNTSDVGSSSLYWKDFYLKGVAYLTTLGQSMTFSDNLVLTIGTGTGLKIGAATNNKIAFFNSAPVVQAVGTADIRTTLINYGFIASGGASPLNLNGGTLTCGSANVGAVTIAEGSNVGLGTTTGTTFGTTTAQKLSFYAATPIVQSSATGETVGFSAVGGTGANDQSTFTGNVGTTAYRISDIVKALKNLGLIKS